MDTMEQPHDAPHVGPVSGDLERVVRDLRIRVGLLQSELEQLRREHAALKSGIAHDVALLARRYLDSPKPQSAVRTVDGVIFGGWDHQAPGRGQSEGDPDMPPLPAAADRDSRTA